jgi:hypothetical protein
LAFSRSHAPDAEYGESKSAFRSGASAVTHLDDGMLAGVAIALMNAVHYVTGTLGIDVADLLKMATLTPARLLGLDHSIDQYRSDHAAGRLSGNNSATNVMWPTETDGLRNLTQSRKPRLHSHNWGNHPSDEQHCNQGADPNNRVMVIRANVRRLQLQIGNETRSIDANRRHRKRQSTVTPAALIGSTHFLISLGRKF